ncbi:MAG: isoprenyl transferase [Candidatus Kapaibacterium sp.]
MNWSQQHDEKDKRLQEEIRSLPVLPEHVAIIMDGNGRWANSRRMPRVSGHKQGVETVREIVKASSSLGLKYLTLYAFSLENWKRPQTEVTALMKLLESYLKREIEELHENNVRVTAIGKLNALPSNVHTLLSSCIEKTSGNTGLTLNLALSYGSRWDIVRASQLLALDVRRGKLSPEDITDELFSKYLVTGFLPDPDMLIRTSGEMRVSNFLLWEIAYAEIYVTEKFWPEFEPEDLYVALRSFAGRERRFGMTSAQVTGERDSNPSYIQRVVNALSKRS